MRCKITNCVYWSTVSKNFPILHALYAMLLPGRGHSSLQFVHLPDQRFSKYTLIRIHHFEQKNTWNIDILYLKCCFVKSHKIEYCPHIYCYMQYISMIMTPLIISSIISNYCQFTNVLTLLPSNFTKKIYFYFIF